MGWATRYIEGLAAGSVSFRPHGRSMEPLIYSGDLVTVTPVLGDLCVGDIVLCKVGGRQYLHKIVSVRGDRYQIGNNRGHVNGWTSTIYGKVVSIEH